VRQKAALYAWWWGFVIANGLVAAMAYQIADPFFPASWHPWVRAVAVGLAFLAFIRLKFATFKVHDKEVPFGLEAFYDEAKRFVFKRINQIAKAARYDETVQLASTLALQELVRRVKLSIEQDSLLTPEERRDAKAWVLTVINDHEADEYEKKTALANYFLSGQR
jgi:hypothetical protein